MAGDWQTIGLVLALELIFASGVAALTRKAAEKEIEGQTYFLVVLGVAGVVTIMGLKIGFEAVGWLALGFSVAAIPMGLEYYDRLAKEKAVKKAREKEAEQALVEAIERKAAGHGDTGEDREE